MKFAYADPPYFGCGKLYAKHHPKAAIWDTPKAHAALVERLCRDYPDGWAMSLSTPSLKTILPMCPDDVRVMAWVKPFAIFKPNVNPAYAWEPVIVRGGRKRTRQQATVRDWVSANVTLKKGLTGAKPPAFCHWVFDVLGAEQGDSMTDIFPGTGIVGECWDARFGVCPECEGTGEGTVGPFPCRLCRGTGLPQALAAPAPAPVPRSWCKACEGKGYTIGGRCHVCNPAPAPAKVCPYGCVDGEILGYPRWPMDTNKQDCPDCSGERRL